MDVVISTAMGQKVVYILEALDMRNRGVDITARIVVGQVHVPFRVDGII
jgi:hypothetical protein